MPTLLLNFTGDFTAPLVPLPSLPDDSTLELITGFEGDWESADTSGVDNANWYWREGGHDSRVHNEFNPEWISNYAYEDSRQPVALPEGATFSMIIDIDAALYDNQFSTFNLETVAIQLERRDEGGGNEQVLFTERMSRLLPYHDDRSMSSPDELIIGFSNDIPADHDYITSTPRPTGGESLFQDRMLEVCRDRDAYELRTQLFRIVN